MNEEQLITLLANNNAPLTLLLFLYLFFKLNKLENKISMLDGKICVILSLINNNERKESRSKREDTSENVTEHVEIP